jgi:hypothetical protein
MAIKDFGALAHEEMRPRKFHKEGKTMKKAKQWQKTSAK